MSRLTKRGKIVLGIVIVAFIVWANNATTPKQCKVPTEQMSQFCLDLLYP
jgi:hypothetical protein